MIKQTIKNLYPVRSNLSNGKNFSPGKIIAIVSLLIIAFSFFYSLVIFPYQNQKTLDACLLKAKARYSQEWDTTCLSLYSPEVIQRYGADNLCASMDAGHADPLTQGYYSRIDNCLTAYPQ